MALLKDIVDDKVLRVLRVLAAKPNDYFHLKKISYESKVSIASTFRIINQLRAAEIIECNHISKFKIYRLSKSKKAKRLVRLI